MEIITKCERISPSSFLQSFTFPLSPFIFHLSPFTGIEPRSTKKERICVPFFCSATRTRTGVYGVRGRCPRPLDDSTSEMSPFIGETGLRRKGHKLLLGRKRVQNYCFFLTYANFWAKKCILPCIFCDFFFFFPLSLRSMGPPRTGLVYILPEAYFCVWARKNPSSMGRVTPKDIYHPGSPSTPPFCHFVSLSLPKYLQNPEFPLWHIICHTPNESSYTTAVL